MPTLARLKKRADFLRVAAQRRKWAAPGLILQAAPADVPLTKADSTIDVVRVGFTVSKKVGNSVERNRARRRLKAAAAEILPLCAATGLDLVVIGRRESLTRPYSLLLQDLRTALKRVGALRPGDDPQAAAPREAGKQ
ncbi:MAG TPA: ribonuclease P protein component [Candidatus Omnitrophota bacterium]|nr:ribonuclease P protein component [Candidatus Omnitrophota bacterium]